MQSRTTFKSSTLEEVLETWRMERLSAVEDNVQVIHIGGSAGDMALGEAQCSRGYRSSHPHWRKCWRHGAWRGSVQSRITFKSSTLEEVLETWRMERLSAVEDNIQVIHIGGSAGDMAHGEAQCSRG